jgi:ribosomal protein S18 acetylase RimI-like enzyme
MNACGAVPNKRSASLIRSGSTTLKNAVEDEQLLPLEQVARQLDDTSDNSVKFGTWLDGRLMGIVNLFRSARPKTWHKANHSGKYVAPEARSNRIGRALLEHTLSHARMMDGLEDVTFAVTIGNNSARGLYLGAGFVPYGVEPQYIKLGNQ